MKMSYLRQKSAWQIFMACVVANALVGCASFSTARSPSCTDNATAFASGTQSVRGGYYRVNPGDTLTGIATSFGRDVASVARWNHILPSDTVLAGQVLRVAPVAETSVTGDDASTRGLAVHDGVGFQWPARGPIITPFAGGRSKGIDIGGTAGEPVKAAQSGRVVYAGEGIKAYGLLVIIKHNAHLLTAYGNNRRLLISEGAVVNAGQVISEMGAGADGEGSLRFEIRKDGRAVDPRDYLPKQ
ncbi:peptidoglycan DD-metalloendopeptidase family protein [Paraburkholderia sp. BR14263]|uniref:peptidoglycan DD-metalloendopeptidase family protein n=1 Tax=unclassified Paraburkholderia TaxID=2615204 RepID=UPI0034CD78F4